jgi:hypothetical protein
MEFTFVHAGDLHLEAPFQGLNSAPPAHAGLLRDAALEAFDAMVALAMERRAAFLLVSGDVFASTTPNLRARARLRRGLERLGDAGIPSFLLRGADWPEEGWPGLETWPDGVTVFGPEGGRASVRGEDGAVLATIHGKGGALAGDALAGWQRGPETGLHIGLLQCEVHAREDGGAAPACAPEALRGIGLDYWALGHRRHGAGAAAPRARPRAGLGHQRQFLSKTPPWMVYAGNLQGRTFAPLDRGAGGALVVQVQKGAIGAVDFHPLDRVRLVSIEMDSGGAADLDVVAGRLREQVQRRERDAGGRVAGGRVTIARARLRGALPGGDPIEALRALRRLLDRGAAAGEAPLAWDRIDVDDGILDQEPAGEDFVAGLLRLARSRAESEAGLEAYFAERLPAAAPPFAAALPGASHERRLEVLRRAAGRAARLVEKEAEA